MNILITGSNSFIGSYFKNNSPQFFVGEVDLLSTSSSDINFNDINVVFHVAAIVHQDKTIPVKKYYEVNSELAYKVAQKAKNDGVAQFVFMSTVKVYGENSSDLNPWNEDSPCYPSDAYGKSKFDAEQRLLTLADERFTISIIRTPVVYGAGVKGNILKMARFVKKQKIIPFNGINNKRAMVYIANLVALIQEVIYQKKEGVFLAGDERILSTSEFVKYLVIASNERKYFINFPVLFQKVFKLAKPNLSQRIFGSMVIDNSKTLKLLNFKPPYTPEQGLSELMASL